MAKNNMRGLSKVMSGLQDLARTDDGERVATDGRKVRGKGKKKMAEEDVEELAEEDADKPSSVTSADNHRLLFSSECKLPRLFTTFAALPAEVAADVLNVLDPDTYRKSAVAQMIMTKPEVLVKACLSGCKEVVWSMEAVYDSWSSVGRCEIKLMLVSVI